MKKILPSWRAPSIDFDIHSRRRRRRRPFFILKGREGEYISIAQSDSVAIEVRPGGDGPETISKRVAQTILNPFFKKKKEKVCDIIIINLVVVVVNTH